MPVVLQVLNIVMALLAAGHDLETIVNEVKAQFAAGKTEAEVAAFLKAKRDAAIAALQADADANP